MSGRNTYRIYIQSRSVDDVLSMIRQNPDASLPVEAYTDQGFVTSDVEMARSLKRGLQSCLEYAFQTERVARRNSRGRHQTAQLESEWSNVRVIIDPDPDAARLLR